MTTDTRLGMLEGRADEQAAAIADLRAGQREIMSMMNSRFDGADNRFESLNSSFDGADSRIDRVFFGMIGIGAAQIALLITLVVRG